VDTTSGDSCIQLRSALMSLPLVAVFAVAQRKIISGITSGAVK
jgi:ABC-type maltose transport system permease subunit